MSKQAISAAGSRRWRLLVATLGALAAVAFGVTFLGGTETAKADATIRCGIAAGNPPTAGTPNVNQTVYCDAVTGAAPTANSIVWGVTANGDAAAAANITNASGAGANGTAAVAPGANFTFDTRQTLTPTGGGASYTVTLAYTDANGPHSANESGQTVTVNVSVVTGTVTAPTTNAAGTAHTATFSLPAQVLCVSDAGSPAPPAAQGATARTCANTDVTFNTTGGASATVTGVVVTGNRNAAGTVTVTFNGSGAGTVTPVVHVYNAQTGTSGANQFAVSTSNTKTYALAELRHIDDNGAVILAQDVPANVRGSRHTVCTVAANSTTPVTIPLNNLAQISVQSGGGYWYVTDPDPTFTSPSIFTGTGGSAANGLSGATCFSWTSTEAGDQEISVVYTGVDGLPYTANWDSDANGNGGSVLQNRALIKEWNVLEGSTVTATGGKSGSGSGTGTVLTLNVAAIFNPATSRYDFGDINLADAFYGSHVTRTGSLWDGYLAGVWYDAPYLQSGSCGAILNPSAQNIGVGTTLLASGNSYTIGGGPSVTFTPDSGAICGVGDWAEIVFVGYEPSPLGSGSGNVVEQRVRINIVTAPPPTKHVFLAWAGQRVVLEHDWRLPPGDTNTTTRDTFTANGVCAFDGSFVVDYVRGSGPGNFVAGLGASQYPSGWRDGASVLVSDNVSQTGDASSSPQRPQDACISRVIYESEDEGQVDVEAFADTCELDTALVDGQNAQRICDPDNQTKIAFVIYYMKIEKVAVSLVTGNEDGAALVKKPRHNATNADFSPGNPWRSDNDLTAGKQNVSTDVLVRARVKGWFRTSNPSGRERDATDPNNVLPQDRWVMPDDWAKLIAGGAGIDFRPEYDYMFAPNNTKGETLDLPDGSGWTSVTKVVASTSNTTTAFKADSIVELVVGQTIRFGTSTTAYTITAINTDTNVVTYTPASSAANPADTLVRVNRATPFEGPFSLIDIQDGPTGRGYYELGFGSAALSNLAAYPGRVRDTRHGEQVLDQYDAPMPSTPVTFDIRKAGFIKQVYKHDVYWTGTVDSTTQDYPNPYYYSNIPESPYLPSKTAIGDFIWDSWGTDGPQGNGDGPYLYWQAVKVGLNISGNAGESLTTAQQTELSQIRTAYNDTTIARRLVVFSDNHGEAMVIANGDFNLTFDECDNNLLGGGKHCDAGDLVGKSDVFATADYPDFRGKHAPVRSNTATIDWTWGGYKTVTIEPGEVDQYVYVVFRALDRDGFCSNPFSSTASGNVSTSGTTVSLHPVLTSWDASTTVVSTSTPNKSDPNEMVDFLIDSDEGGIIIQTSSGTSSIDVTREATKQGGIATYSTDETGRSETATDSTRKFKPLGSATVECQSWIKLSNSLLGITNVLVFAADDEGLIGFDKIVDFNDTTKYTLNFRWSLITWMGANNITPADALGAKGKNAGGTSILDQVTAVYGWEASSQSWLAFFPDGVNIPGANDLTGLKEGNAYWIAIKGPSSITWSVVTNVD